MLDIVGKPLRHRAIVLFDSFTYGGLHYGIIEQIHSDRVEINIAFIDDKGNVTFRQDGTIDPAGDLIQIKRDQIHPSFKDALMEKR